MPDLCCLLFPSLLSVGFFALPQHLLFIYMNELHVHRVNRCENIGSSLYNTLSRLGHSDRRASSQEDWLVATAQR
jgi:hypothetical protein